ncbi:MAG: rhodanese-like domain-containing protein [Cyanobacteria bacterium P01_A01_bin.135]
MPDEIPQITVEQLAERRQRPEPFQLVDVREPEEVAIAALAPCTHLPLSQFPQWGPSLQQTLDPHAETIVLCHHGIRSAQMCQWLQNQGFTNVKNVAGGIDAYAVVVDPALGRY